MKKSINTFMKGIVDYAGLFPPAKLELGPAIKNYAEYRKSAEQEMLSAFIIPAVRLSELEKFSDLFEESPPFIFSVLAGNHESEGAYFEALETGLDNIRGFYKKLGNKIRVTSLEIKIPDLSGDPKALKNLLDRTARNVNAYLPNDVSVFYEPPPSADWKKSVPVVTEVLKNHNDDMSGGVRYIKGGYKVRCGGIEAHMFPETEHVASVICHCHKNGVPFKATAGLHHPVRHFSKEVNTKMHGFFNVFGAAILTSTYSLTEEKLNEILQDENAEHFHFDDRYFSWMNMKATLESIENARQNLSVSYGSCSFTDPLNDLTELGYR